MRTAFFDCYNGVSGDMTLGALIDLGVPIAELQEMVRTLGLTEVTVSAQTVQRCGVAATQVHVHFPHQHVHRRFSDIRNLIEKSPLSDRVKSQAIACFRRLAEAEARVHRTTIEEVHFHEVGALDAIVDIVGSVWALERLGVEQVLASEIVTGYGTVQAAHGELPVPAPATAYLLEGVPIRTGPYPQEMTTPTGAAIVTTLAKEFGPLGTFRVERVGYGAGSRLISGRTNYLRVFLGEDVAPVLSVERRELLILQTEIDDMPGEMFGYLQERLLAAGALDVTFVPIQMKKNRPAVSVQVLTAPEQLSPLLELVLRESTTFGVKVLRCDRFCLPREIHEVSTRFGPIRVKVGKLGDRVVKATPEYEDCRRLALEHGVALPEIFKIADQSIQQWLEQEWALSLIHI
ncbi:MAG: nickel pincer cofactor biosynthesis protein LarC [Candidatus Sumerlaea chitinivorans]|nr:nickel pincer cofactor biosynthesis protein LarC [Candidatus Sumerlaea chitinivorans]